MIRTILEQYKPILLMNMALKFYVDIAIFILVCVY